MTQLSNCCTDGATLPTPLLEVLRYVAPASAPEADYSELDAFSALVHVSSPFSLSRGARTSEQKLGMRGGLDGLRRRAGGSRYQRIEIQEEQPEDAAFWEAEENKRVETDVGNAHGPLSLRP